MKNCLQDVKEDWVRHVCSGWRSTSGRRLAVQPGGVGLPVSRNSSTVLSDTLSLPEAPGSDEHVGLGGGTPSWPPSPMAGLAHGPQLSPRDPRDWAALSAPSTPASARSPLHSPLGSVLAPVQETLADEAGGSAGDEPFGGGLSPSGSRPLQGARDLASAPLQAAQDPWSLSFYNAPMLEQGFAAWHAARFAPVRTALLPQNADASRMEMLGSESTPGLHSAIDHRYEHGMAMLQADAQHLLLVLAACAVGLVNSLSLGVADVLRWFASSCALAAACALAHYCPAW